MVKRPGKGVNVFVKMIKFLFFGVQTIIIFFGIFLYGIIVVFYRIFEALIKGFIRTVKNIFTVNRYWKERTEGKDEKKESEQN